MRSMLQPSSRKLRLLALSVPFIIFEACKEPDDRSGNGVSGEGLVVEGRLSSKPEFYAADATYLQKNSTFFFQVWNQPFVKRLDDLPAKGESENPPYSGSFYSEPDGGTDQIVAGNKSPLQKYDDAFHGGDRKATNWEREKHTTGPSWAGHCNGFSAAAQRHAKEPAKAVVRNGVTFAPQDIKALLAEIYMNADYEFLGGNRCELSGNLGGPSTREDPTVMGICEDINPGTLHAAIANWIGRMRSTLIMDMFAGDQVWNYPLYRYEVLQKQNITKAQAKQYVSGSGTNYEFNPSAAKFAFVKTRLSYAEGTRKEILGQLISKDMELTYVLELDQNGEILGGEWVGAQSLQNHPDFLWVALEPMEPNGTRYMGNPHVDNQEVLKLWAESVGLDPNNMPKAITRPASANDWGHFANFDVVLDGNSRGAVFAGKTVHLRLKRKAPLGGAGILLEVGMNGSLWKSVTTRGEEEIVLPFEPGLGLNRFQFTWKRDGEVLDEQFLRFHTVL